MRSTFVCVCVLWVLGSSFVQTAAVPAPVTVSFKLTDLQYRPLPGASVRLVLGAPSGWQNPDAGHRFVTDANGEYAFKTTAVVDRRSKKVPVDFVSTRRIPADHLAVAAEFEYVKLHWLYTIDVYRFPDGTSALLDPMVIYTPDKRGRFTKKAERIGGSWKMADLGGQMLTNAGYDTWESVLRPDITTRGWILQLAFKKWPEPIRR